MNQTGDLRLIREVAGQTEPVTLAEAKTYLGVTNTAEDTLITSQIAAARQIAEAFLSRDIVSKEYALTFIETRTGVLHLYNAPITSVTSVVIDGEAQVEDTGYELRGSTDDPVIYLTDTLTVFNTEEGIGPFNNVVISYTTTGLNNLVIQEGIKSILSDLYNQGMVSSMYKTILAPYRKLHI